MEGLRTLLISSSQQETVRVGQKLGSLLMPGDVLALSGSLGSGKTTFVKGLALGLGVASESEVKSPTFVLLHLYEGRYRIYHLDLFRLETLEEVENLGWDDLLRGDGILVIEWAEKIEGYLPHRYLRVEFKIRGETQRDLAFSAFGERYQELVEKTMAEGSPR